jgi:hypothetical protein
MLRKIDWERQIGKRMRLRDLHVFSAVVDFGHRGLRDAKVGGRFCHGLRSHSARPMMIFRRQVRHADLQRPAATRTAQLR